MGAANRPLIIKSCNTKRLLRPLYTHKDSCYTLSALRYAKQFAPAGCPIFLKSQQPCAVAFKAKRRDRASLVGKSIFFMVY
jgi:hypothetical protein